MLTQIRLSNKTALRLGLLALVCGLILSLSYLASRETVEANKAAFARQQLMALLPSNQYTLRRLTEHQYEILSEQAVTGHILRLTTHEGYNGEITLWLAVDLSSTIIATRIIRHRETPGLGDKLELEVSDWILSFDGKNLTNTNFKVKRDGGDFDQFSGATITPRSVINVIKAALEQYPDQLSHPSIEAAETL